MSIVVVSIMSTDSHCTGWWLWTFAHIRTQHITCVAVPFPSKIWALSSLKCPFTVICRKSQYVNLPNHS